MMKDNLELMAYYDGHGRLWFDEDKPETLHWCLETIAGQIEGIGPVDGILGWSQGAQLIQYLDRSYMDDLKLPPWRFRLLVSGKMAFEGDFTGESLPFPSLHIYGELERKEVGVWMMDQYNQAQRKEYVHPFGHVFPRSASDTRRMFDLTIEMALATK
jgi:hypothetical protein